MSWTPVVPRWWSSTQRARLADLQREEDKDPSTTWVGYCNRNEDGTASYQGGGVYPTVGLVERVKGEPDLCKWGLHASRRPLAHPGSRVWVVALLGWRIDGDDKSCSLTREWIGEIMPADDAGGEAGLRASIRPWADLMDANLRGANLRGANIEGANLRFANLEDANLSGANRLPDDPSIDGWEVARGRLRKIGERLTAWMGFSMVR